jgi:hypothetical protein
MDGTATKLSRQIITGSAPAISPGLGELGACYGLRAQRAAKGTERTHRSDWAISLRGDDGNGVASLPRSPTSWPARSPR